MNSRHVRVAVLVTLFAAACSTSGSLQSDKVFTEANAGMVMLEIDDQFSVKLDANPSTGFAWHVLISNEAMLIRQGEPVFVPNPGLPTSLGAGGTETFTYRVVGGGETQLRFEYKRAFESDKPPKVVVFDLVVN